MAEKMLTTGEAAERLGLSRRTLEAWRLTGAGPVFVKLGRVAVRYRTEDLAEFARPARSTSEVSAARKAG